MHGKVTFFNLILVIGKTHFVQLIYSLKALPLSIFSNYNFLKKNLNLQALGFCNLPRPQISGLSLFPFLLIENQPITPRNDLLLTTAFQ